MTSSGGPRARGGVGIGGVGGDAALGAESQGPPLAWPMHQATTSAMGTWPIMLWPASTMSPATRPAGGPVRADSACSHAAAAAARPLYAAAHFSEQLTSARHL